MNLEQARRLRDVLLDSDTAPPPELHGLVESAVLVPLYVRDGDLHAVFIRRGSDLRTHAGQISFPGGREEPGDRDLFATALRETTEEIGLYPEAVTLLGALSPVTVRASGFALYSFVAAIERPAKWMPAATEVDAILELALAELARSYAVQTVRRAARNIVTPTFDAGGELLWGATARILTDLLIRVGLLGAG